MMEEFELGIRGWMIIIGVLLILAVLLDGYRRMRHERRGNIRVSMKMGGSVDNDVAGDPDEELYKSELPNGGARVVNRNKPGHQQADDAQDAITDDQAEYTEPQDTVTASREDPDAVLELEPLRADRDERVDIEQVVEAIQAADELAPSADKTQETVAEAKAAATQGQVSKQQPVEEVIVINVVTRQGERLKGDALLDILVQCDCRHGDMNIFHRYEESGGKGAVQFSIANAVEPGTFDLDNMESFDTPGLSFFMQLPGPKNPLDAFDCMYGTANCIAQNLGADLLDEARSVMTAQTAEHCREKIRDYERRRLTQQTG